MYAGQMENVTVNQAPEAAPQGASGSVPNRVRRGRWLALVLVLAIGVAVAVVFAVPRKRPAGPPGWVAPPDGVPAIAGEMEANVRRMLDRESTTLATAAEQAGRIPELAALLTSSLDGAAFQDALSNEPWWKNLRRYGCAVLVGDDVKAVWQLPGSGLPPLALARAVGAPAAGAGPGARVVSGPEGAVLGALAPIAGSNGARLLLAEALDRRTVAMLAARANVVMMLSDGRKDLGASVPDATVPLLEGLVGRESSHVQVERRLQQLAVAVPWAPGLWLWVVTGWDA